VKLNGHTNGCLCRKTKIPSERNSAKVRKIFQETLPNCEERMAWGVVTFTSGKFYIEAMKSCVHVGFAITGLNEGEISMFEGSGKTMRHIKIPTLESIDEKRLVKMIEMVDKKAIRKTC
jgi:uncharacterized protein YdhG (YjbR/CyaY superfamily)